MEIRLRLSVLPGAFAVCRLEPTETIPAALLRVALVSITRTAEELSIVCPAEHAPPDARCESGWRCLKVHGPLPFSTTGILASLARPLADAGIPIFAVSTFDTDYVLVEEGQLPRAVDVLRGAGHEVDGAATPSS